MIIGMLALCAFAFFVMGVASFITSYFENNDDELEK